MLYGEQVAAKQCYLATISTKASMKEVQLIEEEREVQEDVERDPETKVMHYELDEPSSDHFFLIGANLKEQERTEFINSLKLTLRSSHGHHTRCPRVIQISSDKS
ncbi:hypothetical protein Acr_24g0006630 [Actinidia rufa]|uniref:Uncharacterized protein n=1 Tax=Actinidia rufa TaxID=165716 RepID=A0A7J0GUK7_9ERIC|nr:hypothetical protein Acr_24g0006630 [Actinidia rufa]